MLEINLFTLLLADGNENISSYLIQRISTNLYLSLIPLVAMIFCWLGREGLSRKKIWFKNRLIKICYTRGLPIIIFIGILYLNYPPIMDYMDPKLIQEKGTLTSVNYSNKRPKTHRTTLKIDGNIYKLPADLIDREMLVKGRNYTFTYYPRSKIIISIK